MMTRRRPPISATTLTLAAVAATISAVSCADLTVGPPPLTAITDSGVVYAINGAPLGAPTALQIATGQLVPANSSFAFDVAFDSAGRVVFLPLKTVASGLATTYSVGLQVSPVEFDNLRSAPKTGYRAATALIGAAGVTVLAQSNDVTTCGLALSGSSLYAKIIVTSIDLVSRSMKVTFTVDPNCGVLSFGGGLPEN